MIGDPHGAHQRVGGPHGEIQGEEQAKQQQLHTGVPAHIGEVNPDEGHDLPGQELLHRGQNGIHVQLQQAQQGADKDQ
ncbi:Uncharacterised protein [uncultured Blautia sp.]|nr:Uncharacterised protein [uncultured Blautia sp.]